LIGIAVYVGIMAAGLGLGLLAAERIERAKRKKRSLNGSP